MRSAVRRAQDALIALVPGGIVAYLVYSLASPIAQLADIPGAGRVVSTVLSTVLAILLVVALWIVRNPIPQVDFSTNRFKMRRRTIDIASIDSALVVGSPPEVSLTPSADQRLSGIRIGVRDGPQITVALGGPSDAADREYRERLAEVIRRSSIRYPSETYDPTGKFARYNFPENLDKDGAVAFVLGTPPVNRADRPGF